MPVTGTGHPGNVTIAPGGPRSARPHVSTAAGAPADRRRSRRGLVALAIPVAMAVAWAVYLAVGGFRDPVAPVGVLERSFRSFAEAVTALGTRLAELQPQALAIALGFVLLNLVLRSRAWRNILLAAYPDSGVRWRSVFGSYVAGVGVNAVLPARAGDPVKLYLVKGRTAGSSYPGLAASLVAETLFDAVMGLILLVWALQTGALPGLPELPRLPAFDLAFVAERPWLLLVILAVIVAAVLFAAARVRAFWARVAEGLAILRTPRRYVTRVCSYQAAGWGCRVASAYFFLEAFNVPASIEAALLVQVASGLGTLMPATPGGLGPKQALLVAVLAGEAARVDVLAFSVGMELGTVAFTALLGFGCMALMLRGFDFRGATRAARAEQDAPAPRRRRPRSRVR